MDFWAQRCMEEMAESEREGQPPPEHCSDAHMADTVMDFLFASQDASTASLVWMMCLMAQHPQILAKVCPCWGLDCRPGAAPWDLGCLPAPLGLCCPFILSNSDVQIAAMPHGSDQVHAPSCCSLTGSLV